KLLPKPRYQARPEVQADGPHQKSMNPSYVCCVAWPLVLGIALSSAIPAQTASPITFNKNFEGASLGKIDHTGEAQYRCFVEGQHDERGRNRQANWYYFRMDGVQGRQIMLTLTDFIGEYNDNPGACAMNADTIPVFSDDHEHWQHFPAIDWDDQKKEATIQFH